MATWTPETKNSSSWSGESKTLTFNEFLLMESGDYLLLENGGYIVLEDSGTDQITWSNQTKN
jgi:hypothetical protein